MQPNGRRSRGRAWLLRVRQAEAAANQPGWRVHLPDPCNGSCGREPSRGQLRVHRVHGRLRGHLPAALRAPAAVGSAADSTDVPVRSDARGRWRQQQRHKHLHRPQRADAAAAALAASTTLFAAATSGARAAGWLLAAATCCPATTVFAAAASTECAATAASQPASWHATNASSSSSSSGSAAAAAGPRAAGWLLASAFATAVV